MDDTKPRIISFGAATQDVFLSGKGLASRRDVRTHNVVEQFPLGAKVELDGVVFDTGGGATNAAVTFARQGLSAAYVGKIGHDPAGAEILRVLRREGVVTDRVVTDPKLTTGFSTLLVAPSGERVVLVYRGASHNLVAKEVAIRTLEADWFYITSLAGNLDLLGKLLKHAVGHGIQVAIDPGVGELSQAKKLRALLPLVTVLKCNLEELSKLFDGIDPREALRQASDICPIVVGTDGAKGSFVANDGMLYQAGQYQKVKVIDRTGAGDAFGSGFVAALARGQSIEDAITLASANSTSVVQVVGAKAGILRTHRLKRMKVKQGRL